MAAVRQLGAEGEAAANILKKTERIGSATGTATYRIPDVLNHDARVIGDVKNVGRLSYTSQLRDFSAYANANGYTLPVDGAGHDAVVGAATAGVSAGDIILLRTLP